MYDKSIISLKLFDPCYCGDLCANCYKFAVDYDSNEWTELNAYYAGFVCGYNGGKDSENPYKPSGHERDTTYEDQLHFRWYVGQSDGEEERSNRKSYSLVC